MSHSENPNLDNSNLIRYTGSDMIISLPVTQTNNAQNQPSNIHLEPDKRTPLLRGDFRLEFAFSAFRVKWHVADDSPMFNLHGRYVRAFLTVLPAGRQLEVVL
jgi:hypothetical protein